jgi:hypothetical protein
MKNLLAIAALAAAPLLANAQSTSSVDVPLSGTLAKRCTIAVSANATASSLDLTSVASQSVGDLSFACNYAGTPGLTIASLNNGLLVSNDPQNPASVAYTVSVGTLLSNVALTTPANPTVTSVANATVVAPVSIVLANAANVAGIYQDTITATITPN